MATNEEGVQTGEVGRRLAERSSSAGKVTHLISCQFI